MLRSIPLALRTTRPFTRVFSSGSASSLADSTTESPMKKIWTRPLEPGVLPAYDEALAYIERDSENKRAELERLRKQTNPKASVEVLEKLEIESQINLPEVRWNFKQGQMDLTKPVYRYLLNQRWRKMGRLDRLMERVYQMSVIPDVLPSIRPNVDIRVNFSAAAKLTPPEIIARSRTPVHRKRLASELSDVIPGLFLTPAQTVEPPILVAQVFHVESRLYTLIMIDPDVPSTSTQSFQNYLHWLVPNISLSATSSAVHIPSPESPEFATIVPYVPPHPQKGTPYHRYVRAPSPSTDALRFDLRSFVAAHGLLVPKGSSLIEDAAKEREVEEGGGIFLWREIWDPSVSMIYNRILRRPEPVYGPPPKVDPYVDEHGNKPKKYFSTPWTTRCPLVLLHQGLSRCPVEQTPR
ncbi:hypothetical protein BS47DRAFT_1485340 [Hydnum rufescens UP504]|uniref:PEBP-like protein n=1 Tax=Hydnum rufescens UP504 TaxID=1448309 RepID=A0A9P6AXU9_9AGAM|nr:hypothetical protein BS47DRAFT_1485340 [Hydnum rufescens UP504]